MIPFESRRDTLLRMLDCNYGDREVAMYCLTAAKTYYGSTRRIVWMLLKAWAKDRFYRMAYAVHEFFFPDPELRAAKKALKQMMAMRKTIEDSMMQQRLDEISRDFSLHFGGGR